MINLHAIAAPVPVFERVKPYLVASARLLVPLTVALPVLSELVVVNTAKVVASVTDQKGQTLFKREIASNGDLALKLPADLPLTPGRELFLDVVAKRDDGPQSELHERLPLLSARCCGRGPNRFPSRTRTNCCRHLSKP